MKELFYTTDTGKQLSVRLYFPDGYIQSRKTYPAAVLFFGGGWVKRNLDHFTGQAMELSRLGMIVALPDYRVLETDDITLDQVLEDAESAVRCVLDHAEQLRIDAQRLVLGGASAGGHLAACLAMLPSERLKDCRLAERTKALLLFNPVLDTVCIQDRNEVLRRMEGDMRRLSPLYHIEKQLPDTVIFHGTEDQVIAFDMVLDFQKKMRDKGNICEVFAYEGRKHSFFNLNAQHIEDYYSVLGRAVGFLADRQLLSFQ